MSLKDRLYYKAKNFIHKRDKEVLMKSLAISKSTEELNLEFLNIIASIKAYKTDLDTLIDVGSHKGTWAKTCDSVYNFSKIICFEPNSSFEEQTKKKIGDKLTFINKIATNINNKEGTFYIHEDSTMSSMVVSDNKVLSDHFPYDNGEKIKEIKKDLTTLDSSCSSLITSNAKVLLKVDTQGNELDVLKGAKNLLSKNVKVCLVEHMFLSPYKMKYTFQDLLEFMNELEFEFSGCVNTTKRNNFLICDGDFLFIKK